MISPILTMQTTTSKKRGAGPVPGIGTNLLAKTPPKARVKKAPGAKVASQKGSNPVKSGKGGNQAGGNGITTLGVLATKNLSPKAKCPQKGDPFDMIGDVIYIIQSGIQYPELFKKIVTIINSRYAIDTVEILLSCAKQAVVNGKVYTIEKVKEAIRCLRSISSVAKSNIMNTVIGGLKQQYAIFKDNGGIFKMIIEVGIDVALSFGQLLFGLISLMKFIAQCITSLMYTAIKTVSSLLIKSILAPFIGPLAWVLATLLEVGMDLIDFFFDLKAMIADYVEWLMTNTWNFINGLITAVVGVL